MVGVTFSCFAHGKQPVEARMLVVHPRFWFQPGPSLPLELFSRVGPRERFLRDYPLAWVERAPAGVLTPFWTPRDWCRALMTLAPGRPPSALEPGVASALADAGILVEPRRFVRATGVGNRLLERVRRRFLARGYVNVRGVLHRDQIRALAAYYNDLAGAAGVSRSIGDSQCAHRYGWHNESIARFVHRQLLPVAEALSGTPLLPSYTYSVAYREGATLDRHTDREQCAITLALLISYGSSSDMTPGVSTWPLCLDTPAGAVEVFQRVGDLLVFRGRELPHWRPALPPGQRSDSLLLHYVPQGFTGSLH